MTSRPGPKPIMTCANRFTRAGLIGTAVLFIGCPALADAKTPPDSPFKGWQGMRVIQQESYPMRMTAADLNADGQDELVVINPRQARLEVYRYRGPDAEAEPDQTPGKPNELPMAADFERVELGLENLPIDALAHDLDGDGRPELIVLVVAPNRLEVHSAKEGLDYQKVQTIDLLDGNYTGRSGALLIDATGPTPTALVSMSQGIQTVPLMLPTEMNKDARPGKPTWLDPKQDVSHVDWWLADLDHDGSPDLIQWTSKPDSSIIWRQRINGRLLPPQVLYDRLVDQVVMFESQPGRAEIAMLGGVQPGVLRRYKLGLDDEGPIGQRQTLAMKDPSKTPWCVVTVEGQATLLVVDSDQPRLNTFTLDASGWRAGPTYPIVTGVEQITPAYASPGSILMRVKDAGQLYQSAWDGERFSYPALLASTDADAADTTTDRAVLNLGVVGQTTWWTQRVGKDVALFRQGGPYAEGDGPVVFSGLGDKVREAVWLGGERLLVNDQYARQPKLVTLADGKTTIEEPTHLRAIKADELRLYEIDGELRLGRLTEGVLQWLDARMQPTDQVMLPEGARLSSFVPTANGKAWALQAGGQRIHQLSPDDAGILRVTDTHRVPGGQNLIHEHHLGLLLIGGDAITQISPGQSRKLELVQTIDSREGRPSGVRAATIHRIFAAKVTGDKTEQLILADDTRHQLTLLGVDPEDEEGKLKSWLSWPVFEDRKYPYGYEEPSRGGEPRTILSLDIDGDKHPDLAMLSHDRLIIYLGRETKP